MAETKLKVYLFDHSPHLRDEWDYEKNSGTDPLSVRPMSNKKRWWKCKKGHKWVAIVFNRSRRGDGCPVCSNRVVLRGFNDLWTTYPEMAKQLVTPDVGYRVSNSSSAEVDWRCEVGHTWCVSVNSRRYGGRGCPVCANLSILVGYNDIWTTDPEIACELLDKDLGYTLSRGAETRVTWVCKSHHRWETRVADRILKETGCPKCSFQKTSKVEGRLRELLSKAYNVLSEDHLYRLPVAFRSHRTMSVDIYMELWKGVICEYDGSYFHMGESAINRDVEKTDALLSAGYLVIRIREQSDQISLPHLSINHHNLLQLSVPYSTKDDNLIEAVQQIKQWLDEKNNERSIK